MAAEQNSAAQVELQISDLNRKINTIEIVLRSYNRYDNNEERLNNLREQAADNSEDILTYMESTVDNLQTEKNLLLARLPPLPPLPANTPSADEGIEYTSVPLFIYYT